MCGVGNDATVGGRPAILTPGSFSKVGIVGKSTDRAAVGGRLIA